MPPFLKMLNMKTLGEDIVERMSKMIGKIAHKLMQVDLHLKYKEPILSYYTFICESEDDSIRFSAASNLPAFQLIYTKK